MAADLKLCVLGPCKSGKTLLSMALAEQPFLPAAYVPTAAVRVQEISANGIGPGRESVRVALWDVSGSPQYRQHWATLADGMDGVLLVIDPACADQGEKELESFYLHFAQPAGLTTKQCMVLAVDVRAEAAAVGGNASWQGLKGKLGRLQAGFVSISKVAPEAGAQEARRHLDKLLAGEGLWWAGLDGWVGGWIAEWVCGPVGWVGGSVDG